jgi:hypothetical protein
MPSTSNRQMRLMNSMPDEVLTPNTQSSTVPGSNFVHSAQC